MKTCTRASWLLGAILLLAALLAASYAWLVRAAPPAPADAATPPANSLTPAAHLKVLTIDTSEQAETLLDPEAAGWKAARATTMLLSRTPRIYQTEPVRARAVPECRISALRAAAQCVLRLDWTDATKNVPAAPPARTGEAGEPKLLYKRPTNETAAFADAAAVMVPERWDGPEFRSLLMGDKHAPATLYYWNASRGAEVMKASGRATPQPTGVKVAHRARHADGHWLLTLAVPAPPAGHPVAVALWNGECGDRDGLKSFSIWYVLSAP